MKPLVGVHHMQAHALTPRMVSALEAHVEQKDPSAETVLHDPTTTELPPKFPFLSVLAS